MTLMSQFLQRSYFEPSTMFSSKQLAAEVTKKYAEKVLKNNSNTLSEKTVGFAAG